MNEVIGCKNLVKTFCEGKQEISVLKGVNFSVQMGELVSILGVSGTGKSTLLHLLGGLDTPTSGEVLIAEHALQFSNDNAVTRLRNQHLGFVYQFHHILPEFNALENVAMPLLIRKVLPTQAKEKAEEILVDVGLKERLTHRLGELSGGERQRVAIARALVAEPQCVLADEPTGNLDEKTAAQVYELILELNQKRKTSFVIVTHNRQLVEKMNRVLTLENGILA